jgi:hypothetical protein
MARLSRLSSAGPLPSAAAAAAGGGGAARPSPQRSPGVPLRRPLPLVAEHDSETAAVEKPEAGRPAAGRGVSGSLVVGGGGGGGGGGNDKTR